MIFVLEISYVLHPNVSTATGASASTNASSWNTIVRADEPDEAPSFDEVRTKKHLAVGIRGGSSACNPSPRVSRSWFESPPVFFFVVVVLPKSSESVVSALAIVGEHRTRTAASPLPPILITLCSSENWDIALSGPSRLAQYVTPTPDGF